VAGGVDPVAFALGLMLEKAADRRAIKPTDLVGVSSDTVALMRNMHLVKEERGFGGEVSLQLFAPSLFTGGCYALGQPVPAVRTYPDAPPLKLPKLRLKYLLHEQGWRPGDVPLAFVPGHPLVYNPSDARPVSYFCALLDAHRIFEEGVDVIKHGCRHGYYLVLLKVTGDALIDALANGEDQPAEHWNMVLQEACPEPEEDPSDDDLPPPRPLQDLPPLPIVTFVRVRAEEAGWGRCWVTKGPLRTKVWFDHCSGPQGIRRGWCNCSTHSCGKLKPVSQNRDYMAAAFVLWLEHGIGDEAMGRAAHMAFWPDDAAIRAAIPLCTFEPF